MRKPPSLAELCQKPHYGSLASVFVCTLYTTAYLQQPPCHLVGSSTGQTDAVFTTYNRGEGPRERNGRGGWRASIPRLYCCENRGSCQEVNSVTQGCCCRFLKRSSRCFSSPVGLSVYWVVLFIISGNLSSCLLQKEQHPQSLG